MVFLLYNCSIGRKVLTILGEAKRRKLLLKERYGTPETSRNPQRYGLKNLLPDYGSYYLEKFGTIPLNAWIENAFVTIGNTEGNICWNANGYAATLIVTPEFAESYIQNPSQFLRMIPDPNDA